ncbi:MAG: lysophospholipid acyltransferase family protein [Planctomycetota bacterium]|jgi:KDO2-lipid IV(A) lauroyltransferase|nr:lysophospholipid acyltransferase family protein [Planctomycetota bacterium]
MEVSRLRRIRHAFEYLGVRILVFALAWLPKRFALGLGLRIGDAWRLLDRRRRKTVRTQSADRLGLSPAEAKEFTRRNFRNLGVTLVEFARLSRLSLSDFAGLVDLAGLDGLIRKLLEEGRGVCFITAHFGNWEWCNWLSGVMGLSGGSIARPLDNPRLEMFVKGIREKNGLAIFDKRGAMRQALRTLRNNGVVGALIDQDAGAGGLMSPFLGCPASTITAPVELAMRSGSPILTVALKRTDGPGRRFVARYNPIPHRPCPHTNPKEEIRRLVDAVNADLSRLILEAPEQWFWIHRRWKNQGRNQ